MEIDVEELRAAVIDYYGTGAVSTHYMAAFDYVEKAKKASPRALFEMAKEAGILPKGMSLTTYDMPSVLPQYGFQYLGNASGSYENLQPGDILVKPDSHVEMYIGNGQVLGARGNFDKSVGDSSGSEISVRDYGARNWAGYQIYRYTG